MLKSFEIKLLEPIKIEIGGNEKVVETIEIRKPVSKYRDKYMGFYQELTKSMLSIKPTKEDRERIEENEGEIKEKEGFDQKTATVLGSMHLTEDVMKKLFKFLEIGDDENPTCLIFGEKIQPLEFDLIKDKLDDIDIAAIVGGVIMNFLPLMQLAKI